MSATGKQPPEVAAALASVEDWDGQTKEDLDRYLADCQAQSRRLDEQSLVLGLGWTASVTQTHEMTLPWRNATSSRWYHALGGWESDHSVRYAKQDGRTRLEAMTELTAPQRRMQADVRAGEDLQRPGHQAH